MFQQTTVFTDGASRGNPGPGGWAAVILAKDHVRELGGREVKTTNNRMELLGVISALESLSGTSAKIVVYSDSKYVVNGATKWVKGWKKNGWITSTKAEVLNRDLWERMDAALEPLTVEFVSLAGHAGIP